MVFRSHLSFGMSLVTSLVQLLRISHLQTMACTGSADFRALSGLMEDPTHHEFADVPAKHFAYSTIAGRSYFAVELLEG